MGDAFQIIPTVHAEPRALRKLNWGSTMFVARVMRNNKEYGMARPCPTCQIFIKSKGIEKVYYSVNSKCFGKWVVKKDTDRIYKF
jgi:deoxycytidylate deaminase